MAKRDNKRYYSCTRKQAYSKKEAHEIAMMRSIQRDRGGYAYPCNYCGWWHITKKARNSR